MRRYTKKDAWNYSAAYTDPTRLAQERQREHETHVASIKHFKGEEPELPEGVTENSEDGLKLYKKAAEKAAEAQARRKLEQRKRDEEAKEARLRGAKPRNSPPRPTLGHTRVEKSKRLARATPLEKKRADARKQPAIETVGRPKKRVLHSRSVRTAIQVPETDPDTVTKGARVVNLRGRKLICDSDDEDELELITKVGSTKDTKAKEDLAPGKRTIIDVDADDSLSDELLKNKRRRGGFATVRSESDKENLYEKRTTRLHPKAPGSPTPMPRKISPTQNGSQRANAVPKAPSEKMRELNEKQRASKSNILTARFDDIKHYTVSRYSSATRTRATRPALAESPSKREKSLRRAQGPRLSTPHERNPEIRAEKREDPGELLLMNR